MNKLFNNGAVIAVGLIVLLSFSGCENSSRYSKGELHLEDYKCTPEQFKAVEKEYKLCQETGYLDSYCFASAKATLCDKVERVANNN